MVLGDGLPIWSTAFVVAAALVLLMAWAVRGRKRQPARVSAAGPSRLQDEIARAAETGGGVHIALGTGGLAGDRAMASVAGLRIAEAAADLAVSYGLSPVLSVGEPTLLPAAQDVLRRTYESHGIGDRFDPAHVRFLAPGEIPFAAGVGDAVSSEQATVVVVAGSHGAEVALTLDPGVRRGLAQYVAIESGPGSAASFAATDWLAPGEGLFAAAADESADPPGFAGLLAQDVMRWVLVGAIVVAALRALIRGLGV